ncbi:MAG: InlB B-repeat-containing protein [Bacilli bacterium]|nr:InlB B-repeat-containing protein [Bacilli bacterium]
MKKLSLLVMPLMAITFLASCNQKTYYTVSFNTTGGSSIASQKVEKGKTATKPTDPTKENYYFKRWLLDDARFDFNMPVNQDITLTATWDIYDDNCPYLTFNAEEESTVKYVSNGYVDTDFYYSYDMKTWKPWSMGSAITIEKSKKIYVKNEKENLSVNYDRYVYFIIDGKVAASGDISSLVNTKTEKDKLGDSEYIYLFKDCKALVRAPKLPATRIGKRSYDSMFYGCTNLIEAPDIFATELDEWSCLYMFYGCTNLVDSPNLPAKSLAVGCYYSMFEGCNNLKKTPIIFATQLKDHCCEMMFKNCFKLEKAPELLAPITAPSCYHDMFYHCDALTEGPALPATELSEWCYAGMFLKCRNLVTAPYLPASSSELKDWCYRDMFNECPKLQKVEVGFGTKDSSEWPTTINSYTHEWFNNDTGKDATNPTFYWRGASSISERGISTVPKNWSIQTTN